jgi:DNA polymerase III gamma/tau subunit
MLLIREGAGTRTLNLTTEQAAEMEALAERIPVERLLQSIRLFNEAATDLRRGLQTVPQLPLELALVEISLEPGTSQATAQPVRQKQVLYQAAPALAAVKPAPAQPKAEVRQAAEQAVAPAAATETAVPASASTTIDPAAPVTASESPAAELAAPTAQAPAAAVNLAQVEGAWDRILQAVRQRNPLVEGALRTNCKPVEVYDDEVVIAFPYPFLREKLGDPRRRAEIQDALSEVLGARCRVKLVMESEHTPRPQASSQPRPAAPESSPAEPSPPEPSPPEPSPDDQTLEEAVSRWAAEHGGETKIVPNS